MLALRGRASLLATLLLVGIPSVSSSARAQPAAPTDQDKAAARAAATQGAEAFAAKRYTDTIDLFMRAESMVHAPPHLLMIARAHAAMGHLVVARENYLKVAREDLPKSASPGFRKAVVDAQAELKDLEPRIASLHVSVTPKDASSLVVLLDGAPVPAALVGIKSPVDPGKHTLVATAKGVASKQQTITLAEGASLDVTLELVPVDGASSSGPAIVAPPSSTGSSEPPPASNKTPPLRYVSYGAVGVGVVGLGVGVTFAFLSTSKRSAANSAFDRCGAGCSGAPADEVRALDHGANVRGNVSIAAFAAGAVFLGGGITGILLTGTPAASTTASSYRLSPVVTPGMLGAVGTW